MVLYLAGKSFPRPPFLIRWPTLRQRWFDMRATPIDILPLPRREGHPTNRRALATEEFVFVLEAGIAIGLFVVQSFLAIEA
jgi:hypothetical protein